MDPTQEAIQYIHTSCPRIGAFRGTSDVFRFLKQVASEMTNSHETKVFPSRYIEHVAYAIDMVASYGFLSPPAAVASVYLNTRFEFYFRILSGKLNADGTWITPSAKAMTNAVLSDSRLRRNRVDSVALTYKIMKIDKSLTLSNHFAKLDSTLYPNPMTNPRIADIGDRIEYLRHRVAHGHWGDISAEGVFYGLVTAIIFYNQG